MNETDETEWEVDDVRVVKWDKEQTAHLRARLASVGPQEKEMPCQQVTAEDTPGEP